MLELSYVNEFMYENFEGVKSSGNGNHFLARCIFCGDSKKSKIKKRFNLDYNNGNPIYHCFNCGRSGSFLQLYSLIKGLTIDESKKELYRFNTDYLIQKLSKRKEEKVIKEIKYKNHNWILKDCISEDDETNSYIDNKRIEVLKNFRKERCLTSDVKLFFAFKGDYKNRIIIPVYDKDDNMVFFQARTIPGSSLLPKYKNPTIKKFDIIYNEHIFDRNKYIIVTEGLIDALMIKEQGTTCFGVEFNESFLERLFEKTDKGIILVFDNDDAGYESMNVFMKGRRKKKPNKYNKKVKYFIFPNKYMIYKDINNFVVDNKDINIYDFIVENSYDISKTYIKLKMLGRIK